MAKFQLQQTVMTSGVAELIDKSMMNNLELAECIHKFVEGDFGTLCKQDVRLNNSAIKHNDGRVMGEYTIDDTKIWIITYLGEGGYTTVLLPSEY